MAEHGSGTITRAAHRQAMDEQRARLRAQAEEKRQALLSRAQASRDLAEIRGRRKADATHILTTAARLLQRGDVVLDCGANIGDFSTYFTASPAEVLAFEPNPDCVAHFRDRFADHPHITVEEAAVGVAAGRATLRYHRRYAGDPTDAGGRGTASSIHAGRADGLQGPAHEVAVICLADRIRAIRAAGRRIALLKIDVEGTELELMEQFLADNLFDEVAICLIETHEMHLPEEAARYADLRARIAARYDPAHVNLEWF